MCMWEFSIAQASGKPVFFPICLCRVEDLPASIQHIHMEICPKGRGDRLQEACKKLLSQMQRADV